MIEKVNPSHPDKVADRIAGAIVDLAYKKNENPKIAVEALIGHGDCYILAETSEHFDSIEIQAIVDRIAKEHVITHYEEVKQNDILANNQIKKIKCGDNGIFKGMPLSLEQKDISKIAREIYKKYPSDGKYILNNNKFICCQSNAKNSDLKNILDNWQVESIINPLGEWTGGINVDTGAVNRKLGSDMAESVTGGGLHGKDLSKSDVSVNIYAFLKAQETQKNIELCCAIGDDVIDGKPYEEIVKIARNYINTIGGFEKFAEWGLF